MERIYATQKKMAETLDIMRLFEHMKRYNLIKRYCYGNVVDAACGSGYGSFLLSNVPDVRRIVGMDISEEAISYAKKEFFNEKVEYVCVDILNADKWTEKNFGIVDVVVSLETIEHLKNPELFAESVKKMNPSLIIMSFPDKKSTHFNPHHYYDFVTQNIVDMFNGYIMVREFSLNDVTMVVFVRADKRMPEHIFRNAKK